VRENRAYRTIVFVWRILEVGLKSHGRRIWSFARISLKVKVKSQKLRSPGTKNVLCTHKTPAVWTEWNDLVADNVAQAADATIRSLRRGDLAALRALVSLIRRSGFKRNNLRNNLRHAWVTSLACVRSALMKCLLSVVECT